MLRETKIDEEAKTLTLVLDCYGVGFTRESVSSIDL